MSVTLCTLSNVGRIVIIELFHVFFTATLLHIFPTPASFLVNKKVALAYSQAVSYSPLNSASYAVSVAEVEPVTDRKRELSCDGRHFWREGACACGWRVPRN